MVHLKGILRVAERSVKEEVIDAYIRQLLIYLGMPLVAANLIKPLRLTHRRTNFIVDYIFFLKISKDHQLPKYPQTRPYKNARARPARRARNQKDR